MLSGQISKGGAVWAQFQMPCLAKNAAFKKKNHLMPTMDFGWGGVSVWGNFAASRPGQLTVSTVNPASTFLQVHVKTHVKKKCLWEVVSVEGSDANC